MQEFLNNIWANCNCKLFSLSHLKITFICCRSSSFLPNRVYITSRWNALTEKLMETYSYCLTSLADKGPWRRDEKTDRPDPRKVSSVDSTRSAPSRDRSKHPGPSSMRARARNLTENDNYNIRMNNFIGFLLSFEGYLGNKNSMY